MKDFEQELERRVNGSSIGPKDVDAINRDAKKFVAAVLRRYDNLLEMDKLYEAQYNVDAVQNVMNLNIQQVIRNTQDVEVVELVILNS